VWNWLRRRTNPPEKPKDSDLKGTPPSPRTKTYSANTGYVYQYVYRGYRQISEPAFGTEYVFAATRDRRNTFPVTIRLLDSELATCAAKTGRELLNAEHYALAKMTLFNALDSIADLQQLQAPLVPEGTELEEHLRTLGRV
jgi:hypothetical protein